MSRTSHLLLLVVLLPALTWACFTSERAAVLGELHPDLEFESLAHQMHAQAPFEYAYKGPAGCDGGHNAELLRVCE